MNRPEPDPLATDPTRAEDVTIDVGGAESPSAGRLRPGDRVGRYVLIEELGMGGMGVVYLGYDTELHRKAALKVLRGHRRGQDTTEGQQRLLREARALAQLSHPNVVTVYDVGVVDDEVYVAMEFVQGQTLREWNAVRRSWVDIVTAYVRAGRGLVAAHAAGLVHRDFKPDNVLIGDDQRPRVVDFGLAWAPEVGDDQLDPSASRVEARREALTAELTEVGAVVGTPTYMAPEQHLGRRPDHRSDQFSFCVALYESLYRRRPYDTRDLDELARAKRRGKIQPPPENAPGPPALFRVIRRGLEPDPEKRWPDMAALISALRRVRTRGRRWTAAASAVVIGAAAGSWWVLSPPEQAPTACDRVTNKLDGVWDPARRQQVGRAIESTGLPYATDAARRVAAALDDYTASWVELARSNCEAVLTGDQSAQLLDQRTACLRRRLAAVQSLVEVLSDADPEVVRRAAQAVEELPGLDHCADDEALRNALPEPDDPAAAQRVEELRDALERARTLESGGRSGAARRLTETVVEQARQLDYGPVLGEALWTLGRLLHVSGDSATAEHVLEEAYAVSLASGHDVQAARAAADLVFLLGYTLARSDDADDWALHARALVRRVDPDGELQAVLDNVLGATEAARRDFVAAKRHFERALSIEEAKLGQKHLAVARTLHNLGSSESELGEYAQARAHLQRALDLRTEVLGPDHPLVGSIHLVLGGSYFFEGDFDRAKKHYDEALSIEERALGPDHPGVAERAITAAFAHLAFGHRDEALSLAERAVAILDHPDRRATPELGRALHLMGDIATDAGQFADAETHYRRALQTRELTLGPEHPATATTWFRLGMAQAHQGHLGDARSSLGRAEQIIETKYGDTHPAAADLLQGTAELHAQLGDHDDALADYERALSLLQDTLRPSPVATGDIRFAMARLYATTQTGRTKAKALASEAQADYQRAGDRGQSGLGRLQQWREETLAPD